MSSHTNWLGLLIMFLLPLGLGVGAFVAASRMLREGTRALTQLFGYFMLLAFVVLGYFGVSYGWALHLESKWIVANPKTRADLESCLSLYSRHKIQPTQSGWVRGYQLQPGEQMVEYWLLYNAGTPLNVVYSTNDTIVKMYPSYE